MFLSIPLDVPGEKSPIFIQGCQGHGASTEDNWNNEPIPLRNIYKILCKRDSYSVCVL